MQHHATIMGCLFVSLSRCELLVLHSTIYSSSIHIFPRFSDRVTNHNSLKHALIIRYYIFNIAIGGARGLPKGAMDPLILKFSINFLLCLVINLKISPKHCFPLEEAWREGVFGSSRDSRFSNIWGVFGRVIWVMLFWYTCMWKSM